MIPHFEGKTNNITFFVIYICCHVHYYDLPVFSWMMDADDVWRVSVNTWKRNIYFQNLAEYSNNLELIKCKWSKVIIGDLSTGTNKIQATFSYLQCFIDYFVTWLFFRTACLIDVWKNTRSRAALLSDNDQSNIRSVYNTIPEAALMLPR